MYSYRLYGNTIITDIEFPHLIKERNNEHKPTDIIIQEGMIPEDIRIQEKESKYCFNEKRSWLTNSTTWLLVEEGKRVTYELRPGANLNYLRTYILGYGMSMLYLQRKEMAFHCAAVSREGEAILIAGESGSGKSTITDALLDMGFTLMADDMAVVIMNDEGSFVVVPGFPYQKLCREVINLRGYNPETLIYIDEEKDKFLVPYENEFCLEEKPLRAMFLLALGDKADKLLMIELKRFDKLHACVNNLFLRKLLKEQRYEGVTGHKCLEIASKVPIHLIRRPLCKDTLEEIVDYIKAITS